MTAGQSLAPLVAVKQTKVLPLVQATMNKWGVKQLADTVRFQDRYVAVLEAELRYNARALRVMERNAPRQRRRADNEVDNDQDGVPELNTTRLQTNAVLPEYLQTAPGNDVLLD